MPLRTRDVLNATNLAWLRVCRGLLKQMKCLDGRDEADRLAALKSIDRLIARYDSRVNQDA